MSEIPDRMVLLDEFEARLLVRLLLGLEQLLRDGAVTPEQLRVLTAGHALDGPDADERLAEVVSMAALRLGRQLRG